MNEENEFLKMFEPLSRLAQETIAHQEATRAASAYIVAAIPELAYALRQFESTAREGTRLDPRGFARELGALCFHFERGRLEAAARDIKDAVDLLTADLGKPKEL